MRMPAVRRIAALSFFITPLICTCTSPAKPDYRGTWVGWLAAGQGSDGYVQMVIEGDGAINLTGEVTGGILGPGVKLVFEDMGDLEMLYDDVLGDVRITRYRPGIDTLSTQGRWSGSFDAKSASAVGIWTITEFDPFGGSGNWMVSRR